MQWAELGARNSLILLLIQPVIQSLALSKSLELFPPPLGKRDNITGRRLTLLLLGLVLPLPAWENALTSIWKTLKMQRAATGFLVVAVSV